MPIRSVHATPAGLLVRARGSERYEFHGLPTWVVKRIVRPGHVVMQRKQLLGIARRAERTVAIRRKHWIGTASRIAFTGLGLAAAGYAAAAAFAWFRYGNPDQVAEGGADPLLDQFMPVYEIVERHHVRVTAPAQLTFTAAKEQDLLDSPIVRAIFKTRELVLGSTPDDRGGAKGLLRTVLSLGWGVLYEIPGREIVVGAVTKPWESMDVPDAAEGRCRAPFACLALKREIIMSRTLLIVATIVIALHGLIHIMGTTVYMRLGQVQGLEYKTTVLGGRWDLGDGGIVVFGALWLVARQPMESGRCG